MCIPPNPEFWECITVGNKKNAGFIKHAQTRNQSSL